MELAELLELTVSEVRAKAEAASLRTGEWFEDQLKSASLKIAPADVPNS